MTFQASDIERANLQNPIAGLFVNFGGKLRREGELLAGVCPFHDGDSFKIYPDGRAHCYGCGWHGDSVDFYREHTGRGLQEAVSEMLGSSLSASNYQARPRDTEAEQRKATSIAAHVIKIWSEATPVVIPNEGSLAESYFQGRGITIPLSPTLRLHKSLAHQPSKTRLPAIVAGVTSWPQRKIFGLHRTYLDPNGNGKAKVERNKMMLGKCLGGAVQLAPITGNVLVLAEGVETALSVYQESGISPETRLPTWACLSTSGLRGVKIPAHIREVIIAADHDELKTRPNGETFRPGHDAAEAKAVSLTNEGKTVKIIYPQRAGTDFNDELMERSNAA